ncbi:unnamed protein product [Bursaphelenchus okinawaensis]|uniref:mannosyl-oligosaccharide 1,3-1,6-alpha-mannosidase n=1 Tax=Bursaphelenchus okinawaensis TaxID=465554 RepID=A0A811LS98_9BILA|nr:unnamed protein product [Bursaphelenchus okinawaensis]CAG9128704.1 unnamed protein product [Bursaphelenchus okinawaensis]
MWPYLQKIDPDATESFLGGIISIYSFGQILASPLVGWFSNYLGTIKIPVSVCIGLQVCGNLIYFYAQAAPENWGKHVMMLARLVLGLGSSNLALLNTYACTASTPRYKSRTIALVTGGIALGVSLGPALQLLFLPLGKDGVKISKNLYVNLYTAPAIGACLMNICAICCLLCLFDESYAGTLPQPKKRLTEKSKQRLRIDWMALILCHIVGFVHYCTFTNVETLAVVLGLSFGIINTTLSTLFSEVLGPKKQGTQQGFFHMTKCSARMVGPMAITFLYRAFGPRIAWSLQLSMLEKILYSTTRKELDISSSPSVYGKTAVETTNNLFNIRHGFGFSNKSKQHIMTKDLFSSIPDENGISQGPGGEGPINFNYTPTNTKTHLDIFIIPHSHNDPGWLQTFEAYYDEKVRSILNNMLDFLTKWENMRFVEAEISFFELWWSEQTDEDKDMVRKIVKKGQLEFVGGAWVMTDEANAHYFNTIMEMFEGHEFLSNNFNGYAPKSQWSIDPFGLSTTVPHLMQLSGIKQGILNRIHHTIKDIMATSKTYEFLWRQPFALNSSENDFLAHIMPYLYFADYQCPNKNICVKFDFYNRFTEITKDTVKEESEVFLEQARLKSQFYRTETVLFLQGHDFDFQTTGQWERTYNSFSTMAHYINSHDTYNATLRIATPSEYFKVLLQKLNTDHYKPLPSLSGDFFPYSEANAHYWTGYFTSRPFYKHMDRELAHHIRSADILFSLAHWKHTKNNESTFSTSINDLLVEARRYHALFQHHDAITGTARDDVVQDYGKKLEKALYNAKYIIEECLCYLTKLPAKPRLIEIPSNNNSLIREVYNAKTSLIVFNSLSRAVSQTVCILVANPDFLIEGDVIQQIQPNVETDSMGELKINKFELCFKTNLIPPLGTAVYKMVQKKHENKVRIAVSHKKDERLFSDFEMDEYIKSNVLTSRKAKLTFDTKTGYIRSIENDNRQIDFSLNFIYYHSRINVEPKSGAYVFRPINESSQLDVSENRVLVMRGPLHEQLIIKGPTHLKLLQRVKLEADANYILVKNELDLKDEHDFEISMRIQSKDLNAKTEQLFTDSNGFQHLRRKRMRNLPLPAQYYPFTTSAFLETVSLRLNALTKQPLGLASLQSGQFEIMLERRMSSDDGKGMEQGVYDNKKTESDFIFYVEIQDGISNDEFASLSGKAQHLSQQLLYPLIVTSFDENTAIENMAPLNNSLPCDVHLVALRNLNEATDYAKKNNTIQRKTKPKSSMAIILHRFYDNKYNDFCKLKNELVIDINSVFSSVINSAKVTSLTGLHKIDNEKAQSLLLAKMDLKTIIIDY